jgi:CubicO group peptidase (beta-lactamase class C family)
VETIRLRRHVKEGSKESRRGQAARMGNHPAARWHYAVALTALLLCCSHWSVATAIPITGDAVPELAPFDAAVTNFMQANSIKGAALAIMQDGRLVLKHGYGWSDQAQTTPLSQDARFRLSSISKSFTASAIKVLIQNGLMATNTAAAAFTGIEPRNGRWGDPRLQLVTVSELIAHSGGWDAIAVPDPSQFEVSMILDLDHAATILDWLSYKMTQPLQFAPGSRTVYSGLGYGWLGLAVQKASNRDYLDCVQRQVCRPWGIKGVERERTDPRLRPEDEPWYDSTGGGASGPNLASFPTQQIVLSADGAQYYFEVLDGGGSLMAGTEALLDLAQAHLLTHGSQEVPKVGTPLSMHGDRRRWRHLSQTGGHSGGAAGVHCICFQNTNGVDFAAMFNVAVDDTVFSSFITRLQRLTESTSSWPGDDSTRISLAADGFSVDASEGELIIGVKRTGASQGVVSVHYATAEGTAIAGTDFTPISGTLIFGDDEITQTIAVPILKDSRMVGNRAFTLALSDQVGAQLGIASATISIESDDAPLIPPAIQILAQDQGAVLPGQSNLTITVSVTPGSRPLSKVEFFAGSTMLDEENKPPYDFTWRNPAAGSYKLTARAADDRGTTSTSEPQLLQIAGLAAASAPFTGGLLREFWLRRPGAALSSLTGYLYFPDYPTGWQLLTNFEAPTNWGNYFGARVRGYILPPTNGNYIFWIAAHDQAQLWLSSNEAPDNKQLIASVPRATAPRQWDAFSSQQSAPIPLEGGQRYYIEALQIQGTGGDHLAVGWQLPNGQLERPIPTMRAKPFNLEPQPVIEFPNTADSQFLFYIAACSKAPQVVESSYDLRTWVPVFTNSVPSLQSQFIDITVTRSPRAFYRVRMIDP